MLTPTQVICALIAAVFTLVIVCLDVFYIKLVSCVILSSAAYLCGAEERT